MRVVVIGGSGNVGTAVLRQLSGEPGIELVGVSRRRPAPGPPFDGVEWHTADIASPDSPPLLDAALRGADAVVHAAWLIQPNRDEDALRRTNVDGSSRVVDAVRRAGGPHLVYLSSIGAYSPGSKDTPVDEDWPTHGVPSSTYSRHKVAVERLLDQVEPELRVTRLRPTLIMQRGAASEVARYFLGGLMPKWVLRPGRLPVVPLPRGLTLQLVHADDVARAVALVLRNATTGAINLAADPLAPAELARVIGGRYLPVPAAAVRAAVAASWRARLQPTDEGWVDLAMAVPTLDTTRARDLLGWHPERGSAEALREMLGGLADHAAVPASPPLRR
jgi:UDP-glucose 4-epimerase